MIASIEFPLNISGEELDDYLCRGWYRMGQSIFTTEYLMVADTIHKVYWLRYKVNDVCFGKKQNRLLSINQKFSVEIKSFLPGDEYEFLYTLYRANIDFNGPPSVASFLFENSFLHENIYDTHIIEIRDETLLIAAGIFDKGAESLAGIMNFYHPAYKKYSLGKYLMLLKINLAKLTQKKFYYPGYIVGNYPKFDYKLFADKKSIEWYFSQNQCWLPFTSLENLT